MVAAKLGQTLLYVPDVEEAAAFYERAFGLSRSLVDPDGIYIALDGGGATLAFADAKWVAGNGLAFAPVDAEAQPPAVEINFFVADVEATYRTAIEAGATAWFPPAPQPWGQTVAYVRDPSGFLIEIATFPPTPASESEERAPTLRGGCHCGNVKVTLVASRPLGELPVRNCGCTFCTHRRLRWTSDPGGRVEIAVADASALSRYRFGTRTADFLVCRHCGQVTAAVSHDAPHHAVINIDALDRATEFGAGEARDFDGEGVGDRLARRAASWTPATVSANGDHRGLT